ncbi:MULTISPECIES: tetratricopeptide repeat-containing sensor histidine kinase [unclassified Croceitalea]|uniref:tetratricopeptide repeat-containing sensor histidine kinase n=1 Tax=unclassified Croceitalea TaxID=2632280 RepID=UPI0030D7734B
MKPLLTFILLVCYFISSGQFRVADSLENIINDYKGIDTTLVNLRQSYVANKMLRTPSDTTWLIYNLKTLSLAEELDFKKGQLIASNNIGVVYHYFQSDPLTALDYYQRAYAIGETDPSFKRYQFASLTNMGLIHYEQEDFDKALPIFKKLLAFPQRKSNSLSNIGNIFGLRQQTDSAVYYFKASIKEAELTGDVLQIANVTSNLGLVQAQAGQMDKGLANTLTSLKMMDSLKLEILRVPVSINAAEVYMYNHDLEKAETYAQASLNAVKSLNNLYTETKALQTLARIQEKKGDYKGALENFKAYTILNDSLINVDRKVEISRKEIQFEADKKETLALAETERQRFIKNASIFGGSGIILASLFAFVLYRRKQKADTAKKEAEFRATVADVELKALRAQMNPHFIFNSLNSIGDYILKNDSQEASDYLGKFARLMRMTLENSDKKEITLMEDITLLRTYLGIEQKRFDHSFDFKIEVTDYLDIDKVLVPPMLLQPFVENSIIHGLSTMENNGKVDVTFATHNNELVCTVVDNGVGRKPAKKSVGRNGKSSKGIAITQNRIDILNRTKNANGAIKIIDKTIGTKVVVTLPLHQV